MVNEDLEVEAFHELKGQLQALNIKASRIGFILLALLGNAALLPWYQIPDLLKFEWTLLCSAVLLGYYYLQIIIEGNRLKMEISLHFARCEILAQGQLFARTSI